MTRDFSPLIKRVLAGLIDNPAMANFICSYFELLVDESCDLSQLEKKIPVVKDEQIKDWEGKKVTTLYPRFFIAKNSGIM